MAEFDVEVAVTLIVYMPACVPVVPPLVAPHPQELCVRNMHSKAANIAIGTGTIASTLNRVLRCLGTLIFLQCQRAGAPWGQRDN